MKLKEALKQVKRPIREGREDIRKVDLNSLGTTASDILQSFIEAGIKGTYDPDKAVGNVNIHGYDVEFHTGGERFYLTIENMSTIGTPQETVSKLVEFLDFIADNG